MKDTTKQLLAGCCVFLAGMIAGEVAMTRKTLKAIDALYEAGGGIYVPAKPKQKEVYVNCTVE